MISPGEYVSLHYPRSTLIDAPARYRLRHVLVLRLRDLVADPLSPTEFLKRPFIRRSRWLVTGRDLEAGTERRFYLGSSQEYHAPGGLRVGLYDDTSERPVCRFPHSFADTWQDRELLGRALRQWARCDLQGLRLRVFADDLRVIRGRRRVVFAVRVSRSAG